MNKLNTKKGIALIVLLLTTININYAQNVNITDANFKAYLVGNTAINTNGDTEIQVSEANAYTGRIYLPKTTNVADLTGIGAFSSLTELQITENDSLTTIDLTGCTALTSFICTKGSLSSLNISSNTNLQVLSCWDNKLTSLDVSNNTALKQLLCHTNNISSLNVSTNVALEKLLCYSNPLGSLNVSTNTSLKELGCAGNNLNSLDISNNLALETLTCSDNQLRDLDLSAHTSMISIVCNNNSLLNLNVANGNNGILQAIRTIGNPDLLCIQIDSGYTPPTNTYNFAKAANASYNTTCAINTSTFDIEATTRTVAVYPNPTAGQLRIDLFEEQTEVVLTVSNAIGQTVQQANYNTAQQIDLNIEGANGLYLVHITSAEGLNKTVQILKK